MSLLPIRMGVVIVEPDAVDLERAEYAAKLVHAVGPIAGVERADALPAAGRWRWLAVGANRRGVGVVFEILSEVQRVELGKDLYAELVIPLDLLSRQTSRPDPNRVDPVIG